MFGIFLVSSEQLVNFGSHDEVVLMEAIDLVGLKLHFAVAPADANVRVMPLGLAQIADFLCEGHCIHEVFELERPFNFCRFVSKLPLRDLGEEFFGFWAGEGWYAALARGALFCRKRT